MGSISEFLSGFEFHGQNVTDPSSDALTPGPEQAYTLRRDLGRRITKADYDAMVAEWNASGGGVSSPANLNRPNVRVPEGGWVIDDRITADDDQRFTPTADRLGLGGQDRNPANWQIGIGERSPKGDDAWIGFGPNQLNPNLFRFSGVKEFARLLLSEETDGGFLSSAAQSAEVGGDIAGIMGQAQTQQRQQSLASAQGNLAGVFANRVNADTGVSTLSSVLGRQSQGRTELTERRSQAKQEFTNLLATTSQAENTLMANTLGSLLGAKYEADRTYWASRKASSAVKNTAAWPDSVI